VAGGEKKIVLVSEGWGREWWLGLVGSLVKFTLLFGEVGGHKLRCIMHVVFDAGCHLGWAAYRGSYACCMRAYLS
jgi:hypothetical protein